MIVEDDEHTLCASLFYLEAALGEQNGIPVMELTDSQRSRLEAALVLMQEVELELP